MKNLIEFEGQKLVENILIREHKRLKDFLKKRRSILSGRRNNHKIVQNSYCTAMKIRP
jgi:hypothetical protein